MNTKIKYGLKEIEKDFGRLTFGHALVSYRLSEGISQKELARKLGIGPQSLCDIEKGRKIPTPERAAIIAKKIGEPVEYWIQLALQDLLLESNLNFNIKIESPEAA